MGQRTSFCIIYRLLLTLALGLPLEARGLQPATTLYEDLLAADLVVAGRIAGVQTEDTVMRFDLALELVIKGDPMAGTIRIRTRRPVLKLQNGLALVETAAGQIRFAVGERVVVWLQEDTSRPPDYVTLRKINLALVAAPDAFLTDLTRLAAAAAVGDRAGKETRLLGLLHSAHSDIVQSAVKGLGHLESQAAVPELIAVLGSGNDQVRFQAVDALREIGGQEAVQAVMAALGDDSARVRGRAARTLGWMGATVAEAKLLDLVRSSSDPEGVRINAVLALRDLGSINAVPVLTDMLATEVLGPALRRAIQDALTELGRPLTPTLSPETGKRAR